jgi:hypothetical protein
MLGLVQVRSVETWPPHTGKESARVRLVITAGPQRVWVVLEPETAEEATALEACAARGSGQTDAERPSCGFRR